jgi:DNA-nicking Smr family endonuclease
MDQADNEVIQIPIDGTLDLHTFNPRDVPDLLKDYIEACLERRIYDLRIIHGKGRGILRDRVHSFLKRSPQVVDFTLDTGASGWGATIVHLKKDISSISY